MPRLVLLLIGCLATLAAGFVASPLPSSQLQQNRAALQIEMTAATKATRVNRRNREYNKMYKSEMRTRIKRVRAQVESGGCLSPAAAAQLSPTLLHSCNAGPGITRGG